MKNSALANIASLSPDSWSYEENPGATRALAVQMDDDAKRQQPLGAAAVYRYRMAAIVS